MLQSSCLTFCASLKSYDEWIIISAKNITFLSGGSYGEALEDPPALGRKEKIQECLGMLCQNKY